MSAERMRADHALSPPWFSGMPPVKARSVTLLVVGLLLLGIVIVGGVRSASVHRRVLVGALNRQMDHHTRQIAEVLASMRGTDLALIEDAVHRELQTKPTTSLLLRSMIKVAPSADGVLECIIDASQYGLSPRHIRSAQRLDPAP